MTIPIDNFDNPPKQYWQSLTIKLPGKALFWLFFCKSWKVDDDNHNYWIERRWRESASSPRRLKIYSYNLARCKQFCQPGQKTLKEGLKHEMCKKIAGLELPFLRGQTLNTYLIIVFHEQFCRRTGPWFFVQCNETL